MIRLGIDIGGSGIKGALVNTSTGEMVSERHRIPTPSSRSPLAMTETIALIIEHFNYQGAVGCGFPTIVKNGICTSPGNLSPSWVGVDIKALFTHRTSCNFTIINDADAAGFASIQALSEEQKKGLVLMITVGTGLGSGAFFNGQLIPNFELGQIPYKEYTKIETWAASSAKELEGLSTKKWAKRFNRFLEVVELITAPNLILVGGGISKNWDNFKKHITIETPIEASELKNQAGIIGAAIASLNPIH